MVDVLYRSDVQVSKDGKTSPFTCSFPFLWGKKSADLMIVLKCTLSFYTKRSMPTPAVGISASKGIICRYQKSTNNSVVVCQIFFNIA